MLGIVARRLRQSALRWLDVVGLTVATLLIFHHIGTFLAGTAYGTATTLPFGVTFTHPEAAVFTTLPIHPVQLYSALLWLIVFVVGGWTYRQEQSAGTAAGTIALFGAMGMFLLGFLRGDSEPTFGYLRAGQYEALTVALIGTLLLMRNHRHQHRQLHTEIHVPPLTPPNPPSHD